MPPSHLLIAGTALLHMLGLGVLFPALPFLTRELGLTDTEAGILLSSYAVAGVIVSPAWGRFSEAFGRKPTLAIGMLGFGAGFAWFGLGDTFAELLAARLLGGLFAAGVLPAVLAYVADVSDPEERTARMGLIGAAIGLGLMFGPLAGGLLGSVDLRLPYFASGALGFATALAIVVWLPESLPPDRRARAASARATGPGLRALAARLDTLLIYSFLVASGRQALDTTLGFLVADRLDGTILETAAVLFAMGAVGVTIQGAAMRPLAKRFADPTLVKAGTLVMAAGLGGIAASQSWAGLVASCLTLGTGYSVLITAFNSELSRAAEGSQGEAQGLSQSVQQLSRAVAPLLFVSLYDAAGTAVPYGLATVLCLLAAALAWTGLSASSRVETPS